jgi:hypothetical protein
MQGVEQGFNNAYDAINDGTDALINNPLTEPLDAIPPGEPITGHPAADFWINFFNMIRGIMNQTMDNDAKCQ